MKHPDHFSSLKCSFPIRSTITDILWSCRKRVTREDRRPQANFRQVLPAFFGTLKGKFTVSNVTVPLVVFAGVGRQ